MHQDGAFIAVHVDDIFAAGNTEQLQQVHTNMSKHLRVKDLGPIRKYLGLEIEYTDGVFSVSQGHYARKILDEFDLTKAYPAPTPMIDTKWDKEDSELLNPHKKE